MDLVFKLISMQHSKISAETQYFEYCEYSEYREKEFSSEEFGIMCYNREKKLKELKSSLIEEIKNNLLVGGNNENYLERILIEANKIHAGNNQLMGMCFRNEIRAFPLDNGRLSNLDNDHYGNYYLSNLSTLIQIINTVNSYLKLEQNEMPRGGIGTTPQIELESIKPKILILRELGIIDYLKEKFNYNNTKIAECIGVIIKEKTTSIRGIISNINGHTNNNTNPENIPALENAITVLNELGCTNEVVSLQNKLAKLIEDKEKK